MKTLVVSIIGLLVVVSRMPGAEGPVSADRDPEKAPKGLSSSDWSSIRAAYESGRHAIVANPDGSHHARNPGQAWLTKFDGRGFTVTPDAGGWSWGLELDWSGEATQVWQEGVMLSYVREDGLTEWFVNDTRGLEQGWTFAHRPKQADGKGLVRLDLMIRGDLRPQLNEGGNAVAFINESGVMVLNYGGLKAWDADGKAVQVRFTQGKTNRAPICVVMDDTNAKYPINIDPVAQQAYLKASNTEIDDNFGICVSASGNTVVVGASAEDSNATGVNGNQADNSAVSSGAAYVFVRIGGSWSQQAYLKASNTDANDRFGISVSISGDTLAVGAYAEDSNAVGINGNGSDNAATSSGAAYVFVRNGGSWSQQAYLKASNTDANDRFGDAVSVSGDTVVVGAYAEDSNAIGVNGNEADNSATFSGAAYVFVRIGGSWSQQAYLKASNADASDRFGNSVSISGDTAVVGAFYEASNGTGVNGNEINNTGATFGAAYVFVRSGTIWSQQAYLKASNSESGDLFGESVGVFGDTVVVGASGEDSNATGVNGNHGNNSALNAGAAYVFVRNGTFWSQQAYLKSSNSQADDNFGKTVSVSGNSVAVGAEGEDSNATGVNGNQADDSAYNAGAAYVFVRIGGSWSQQAYLKASNAAVNDYFGQSVAISGDTVVVGSALEDSDAVGVNGFQGDNSSSNSGAGYIFDPGIRTLTTTAVNGLVSGGGDYIIDTVALIAALPEQGYRFNGWTGDASGMDNPMLLAMDSHKTVIGTFGPDTSDPDDDGLTNYQEILEYGTNPTLPDTDGDSVKDGGDTFPLDIAEWLDNDDDDIGDNADIDDDGDGLSDVDEINIHATNPKRADSDGDGLSDPTELQTHLTNPNIADTDNDGLGDGAEINTYRTMPKVADTDEDGFLDGYEVLTGKSPLNNFDKPALAAEARTAIEFTFPSALGKIYRIEHSLDLAYWTTVESGIAGNGAVIQRFYSTRNEPKRYFRVEEDVP